MSDSATMDVREGRALLRLPHAERSMRGPESKETASVFYNPAMALNRDLSSLLLATRAQDGWTVLDGLAASGVRGIRYALESGRELNVEFNDWNPVAARLVEENCRLNGVEPHVTQRNLAPLLYESVWHVVDIDPFGSPAPFIDAAARAVRDKGLLGLTATDATALAGVYPNVCRRRYLAMPMHNELLHEVALRILAGAAVRQAAKHDVGLTPTLAHATDHYYRVHLAARRGAARADAAMKGIGFVHFCPTCGERWLASESERATTRLGGRAGSGFPDADRCPACGAPVDTAGPLWTGPLVDKDAAAAMLSRAGDHPFADASSPRILDLLAQEAEAPGLFFDIHDMGSRARVGSPRTEAVVDALRASGFRVAPVHFNRLGVRTDAPAKAVLSIVRDAAR